MKTIEDKKRAWITEGSCIRELVTELSLMVVIGNKARNILIECHNIVFDSMTNSNQKRSKK